MLNNQESLLMARKLCAIASDNKMSIEVFENLISKLRTSNTVNYYFDGFHGAYVAIVNNQKAKVYI